MRPRGLVCSECEGLLHASSREMKEAGAAYLRGQTAVQQPHLLPIVIFSDLRGRSQDSGRQSGSAHLPMSWLPPSCWLGSVDCIMTPKSWNLGAWKPRLSCRGQPRKCLPKSDGKSFTFLIILRKQASILLRLPIHQWQDDSENMDGIVWREERKPSRWACKQSSHACKLFHAHHWELEVLVFLFSWACMCLSGKWIWMLPSLPYISEH